MEIHKVTIIKVMSKKARICLRKIRSCSVLTTKKSSMSWKRRKRNNNMLRNYRQNAAPNVGEKPVAKLSPLRTYFALLKGFVCTGILYMPKNFKNSGWLWGIIAMFVSFILTQICADKLLQARQRHPRASFTDLGRLSMGKPGQYIVDVFLSIAQIGFLIG